MESPTFRRYSAIGALLDAADIAADSGVKAPSGSDGGWLDSSKINKTEARRWARDIARRLEGAWRGECVWAPTGVASGALLRAAQPTRAWLKGALLEAPASQGRAVLVALLGGAWWAACRVRVPPSSVAAGAGFTPDGEDEAAADHRANGAEAAVGADGADNEGDDGDDNDDDGDEDDTDLFGHNDDDHQGADAAGADEEARAAHASAEPRCGGGWVRPRCGACGAESAALEVHLTMGGVPGEPPRTGACATRGAWLRRRDGEYNLEGPPQLVNEFEPFSPEALALSLGKTNRLPKLTH